MLAAIAHKPRCLDAGDRHRENVHRLPDCGGSCFAAVNLSREAGQNPRILFLCRPQHPWRIRLTTPSLWAFPRCIVRIAPDDIRKKGALPKNGSLFFTIFQTFMSGPPKDGKPSTVFRRVPAPDFFDFIVVDDGVPPWRGQQKATGGILEYFCPAIAAQPDRDASAKTT